MTERREKLLEELSEIKRKLCIPVMPTLEIGIIRTDCNGNILEERTEPGHSWVRNAWNVRVGLHGQAGSWHSGTYEAGQLNVRDYWYDTVYGFTTQSVVRDGDGTGGYAAVLGKGCTNDDADGDFGIFVGTGTTAWAANQNRLAALIGHGTGSGQLSYGAMAQPSRAYNSTLKLWRSTFSRTFTNSSGATITIRETGLVCGGHLFQVHIGYRSHLFARDFLDIPCVVDAAETATIEYRVILDYSEID